MVDYIQNPELNSLISEDNSSKRWIFLSVFLAIIVVILLVFFFIKYSSIKISDKELSQGTFMNLKEDKEIKFYLEGKEHKIIIDSVHDKSVDIIIQSETITANLKINEEKKFDLDEDGNYDLKVKLKSIDNGNVYLFIKKISEEICTENWDCNNWSECINWTQTRICSDLNNCGTTKGKPTEIQDCIVEVTNFTENISNFNCLAQNGTICNSAEICNGTTINASDTDKCCFGDCVLEKLGPIDCGTDLDCIINASEDCSLAKMTYIITTNLAGIIQETTSYYELKGMEIYRCLFYTKHKNIDITYSEDLIQTMLGGGATQEEINQQLQETNEQYDIFEGKEGVCKYPLSNLTIRLNEWKQGIFKFSTQDAQRYNCSGSLYEI